MVLHPIEFDILWTSFEDWTPQDSLAIQNFMVYFLTKDWFFEYIRERLTEVYDRETVDKLIPFKREHYLDMPGMETISDQELKRIGLLDPYHPRKMKQMDDSSLFHTRQKKGSLNITADMHEDPFTYEVHARQEHGGSNCWAVHGNLTESGEPILTCDPHLAKMINGFWYATRLSWNY